MNNNEFNQNIGKILKLIRESKNLKMEWVAAKAGYADKSTYSRLEAGKIKHISLAKLLLICESIKCEAFKVMLLASIKQFKYDIKSWPEFIQSLTTLPVEEQKLILSIVKELFPAQFEELRLG